MSTKNKIFSIAMLAFTFPFAAVYANSATSDDLQKTSFEDPTEASEKVDLQKISQALGHLLGKNLDSLGCEFDMHEVIKGIEDSIAGKEPPMSQNECAQALSVIQKEAFEKLANKNLEEADAFMIENAKEEGIVVLEKDKLHYKVEKVGEGAVVEKHFSPMVHWTGKFMDGKVFGSFQEDEMISLDEIFPGFSKGVVGMKEGEKRTLYIHPEWGYGTIGYLPPNSLLVLEVEVVKANATPEQEEAFTSISKEESREIAFPDEEALR